jgi:hypothetical protein
MTEIRRLDVKALTRVEGEGALRVRVRGDQVEIAALDIYEPPRFFEKLVVGREIREVPDIVARICGICPAHDRECFGCYGPAEQPNLVSLTGFYAARGTPRDHLTRLTRSYNAWAPEFRAASDALEGRGP